MHIKRKMLLLKALKNGGYITTSQAEKLYSGNNKGKDALSSLQFQGYLKLSDVPGKFVINDDASFPEEVVRKFKYWQDKQSKRKQRV